MAVVVAPAIGPTLGGYLTDGIGWRWIFFLNVPFGILSLALTHRLVHDPPYLVAALKRKRVPVDFLGLGLIALGLGCLQVFLDKGEEDDWFGSTYILWFCLIAAGSLISVVIWELRSRHPIVDLRLFRIRNFAICNILIFLVGGILFGSTVLLPQYEQTLLGYTAETAGLTLSFGGLCLLPLMPLVGWLVNKIAARWLVAFGFALSAVALFRMTRIDLDISFWTAAKWRAFQSIGLAFLFIPITTSSYVGVPPEKNEEGAALLNLSRNLGGSVGISVLGALLARRSQIHQNFLVARVSELNRIFVQEAARLTQAFEHAGEGAVRAARMAQAMVYETVQRQAQALAYVDVLWLLSAAAFFAVPIAMLLAANRPGKGPGATAG